MENIRYSEEKLRSMKDDGWEKKKRKEEKRSCVEKEASEKCY